MTNEQLWVAIVVPMLSNAALLFFVHASLSKRLDDLRDLGRAELRRVEEVLDARLKALEERGR